MKIPRQNNLRFRGQVSHHCHHHRHRTCKRVFVRHANDAEPGLSVRSTRKLGMLPKTRQPNDSVTARFCGKQAGQDCHAR